VADAGLIRILRRVLVKGVVYSWLGEARQYIVMTAFGAKAVVTCLPTLAPIGIAGEF